jgi:hypothetical protein
MKQSHQIALKSVVSVIVASLGMAALSPARADDCNTLIESVAAFLQAPKSPGECEHATHTIFAFVTMSSVVTQQTPFLEDVGTVTVGLPSVVSTGLRLKAANAAPPFDLMGDGNFQFASGVATCGQGEGGCTPFKQRLPYMKVHVIEGVAGAPSSIELIPAEGKQVKPRHSATVSCHGPFMTGYFGDSTAFTVLLTRVSAGASCAGSGVPSP